MTKAARWTCERKDRVLVVSETAEIKRSVDRPDEGSWSDRRTILCVCFRSHMYSLVGGLAVGLGAIYVGAKLYFAPPPRSWLRKKPRQ